MEYIVVIFMLFLILYVISCLCKDIIEGFNIGGEEKSGNIVDSPTCKEIAVSSSNNICIDSCNKPGPPPSPPSSPIPHQKIGTNYCFPFVNNSKNSVDFVITGKDLKLDISVNSYQAKFITIPMKSIPININAWGMNVIHKFEQDKKPLLERYYSITGRSTDGKLNGTYSTYIYNENYLQFKPRNSGHYAFYNMLESPTDIFYVNDTKISNKKTFIQIDKNTKYTYNNVTNLLNLDEIYYNGFGVIYAVNQIDSSKNTLNFIVIDYYQMKCSTSPPPSPPSPPAPSPSPTPTPTPTPTPPSPSSECTKKPYHITKMKNILNNQLETHNKNRKKNKSISNTTGNCNEPCPGGNICNSECKHCMPREPGGLSYCNSEELAKQYCINNYKKKCNPSDPLNLDCGSNTYCNVCKDGQCTITTSKSEGIIDGDTDFKETMNNSSSVYPTPSKGNDNIDITDVLQSKSNPSKLPKIIQKIQKTYNTKGGILMENTNASKTIYVYIDPSKPPCLPGKEGSCSPPTGSETCEPYTIGGTNSATNSLTYTKDGKSKSMCKWENNDSNYFVHIDNNKKFKEIVPSERKHYLKLEPGESWYIDFPQDEDGIYWWCNPPIDTSQEHKICSGLGIHVAEQENILSNSCLNRYEFNININKDFMYDHPYSVLYTYHNLSAVDGINSLMKVDLYQNYNCKGTDGKYNPNNNTIGCSGKSTDMIKNCKTLTYAVNGIKSNKEFKDISAPLTCANPAHSNKNNQYHLACANPGTDNNACLGYSDINTFLLGNDNKPMEKKFGGDDNNYYEFLDIYPKISTKLDCHRYWDTNGSLTGIKDFEIIPKDNIIKSASGVSQYRETAQDYLDYFKDLNCDSYKWAYNEQSCKNSNCNNSECDTIDGKTSLVGLLEENANNPLRQCPVINPYINSNTDTKKPTFNTSNTPNNMLFIHLQISDVLSENKPWDMINNYKDYNLESPPIVGNVMCSSNYANECEKNCIGDEKNSNPCQWDSTNKKCTTLDCESIPIDKCENRQSQGQPLCVRVGNDKRKSSTGNHCVNNMQNYNISGLCSSGSIPSAHSIPTY